MNPFIFLSMKKLLLLMSGAILLLTGLSLIDDEFLSFHTVCLLVGFTVVRVGINVGKAIFTKWNIQREMKRPEGGIHEKIQNLKFKTTNPRNK